MRGFPKPKRWKSTKYRDAAAGQDCKLRLPGCHNDTATVVLAHRNGAGMATKASDHDACDCCYHCHSILDRKDLWPFDGDLMESEFHRGRLETIINRIERGILK